MPDNYRKRDESFQEPKLAKRHNAKELLSIRGIEQAKEQELNLTYLEIAGLYDYFMNCGYISHEFDAPVHTAIKKIKVIVTELLGDV